MSSDINQVSLGGMVNRPTHTTSSSTQKSDLAPAIKPAPKVDLPSNSHASIDPAQSRQNVKEAVSFLNDQLSSNNRGIGFTVNEGSSTPIVTVRNTKTGEVVRQIPNDVVIKIAQNFDAAKGAIEDKKA